MTTTLTARRLIIDDGLLDFPIVTVEDGLIVSIAQGAPDNATGVLTAAFFDVHVHGAAGHDFMAATKQGIADVSAFLAGHGVGQFLPTTVSGEVEGTLRALGTIADAIEAGADHGAAAPAGIHLEGPFVSKAKRGVQPAAHLLEPSVALFDRFYQAARGHIRLMTLAPELPGAMELIHHAVARGVRVSLGHSDADAATAEAAIAAGATSATHTFNAMRAMNHREPGILGTVLDRDELYAEAICDGVHVHPSMVRLWLKAKGPEKGILITDGMAATGMPDGTYTLGDFPVEVRNGVCMAGGSLAGSVLTMDSAVANLMRFTGSPLATAVRLASRNPARMLGMERTVKFAPGCPANFNLYAEDGRRVAAILRGQRIMPLS